MRKLLFFSCFIPLVSFSQKSKSHKFVPYFSSLKVEKLAEKLTSDLNSDSEKVVAIHSWITNTIKYDVKKWLSFDYSPDPIKKTLRRRKTLDYALLFNELCTYSKVKSTIVSGYTKSKYIDITEKFYLDEQSWNAVSINDNWYLIDACLDAGEVVYYKRTFAGYFIFAFSLGTSDRLVYRPHFNHNPQQNYLLKSGNIFKYDHVPANPIWQLMNPILSIESLEKDSSFYFQKRETLDTTIVKDNLDKERSRLVSLFEIDREITDGFSAFEFNPKNNFGIAKSYNLKASQVLPEIILTTIDKTKLIEKCDSVKYWTSKSIQYCDSNSIQLERQKIESIENNKFKKAKTATDNKLLISSTENINKIMYSGLKIGVASKISNKSIQQKLKSQSKQIIKDDNFSKTENTRKTNIADSTAFSKKIASLYDSVKKSKDYIDSKFIRLNTLYATFEKNMKTHEIKSKNNKEITKQINALRIRYYDDLDYILRCKKDSLLTTKFKDDSLLIDGENGPIVSSLYAEFVLLKNDFAIYNSFHSNLIAEYSKFKKTLKSKSNIDKTYELFIDNYKKTIDNYTDQLKDFKKKFKYIYKESKAHLPFIKEEKHQYLKEQFIEFQMYSNRASFLSRHSKIRIGENKSLKKNSEKMAKKTEELRKKILNSKL